MPFTANEICSNAMALLGEDSISSIAPPDNTPRAKACAIRYPMLRDTLLSAHPWNFTITKVQLSREVTPPESQWENQFFLPGDGLLDGVLAVYRTSSINERQYTRFISQNGKILANTLTLFADYQRPVDEAYWPTYFANYVSNQLAADLAMSITKKQSLMDLYERKAEKLLMKAQALDAKAAPANNRVRQFPLIDAHVGGVPGA